MRSLFPRYLAGGLLLVFIPQAPQTVDFSGSYTLTGVKGDSDYRKGTKWTLRVVQSIGAIEVTKVKDGKDQSHKYPLDGTEGDYVNLAGVHGTCKGRLKGKVLQLDIFLTAHPRPHGPDLRFSSTERWELSADQKKLTIHGIEGFLDPPSQTKSVWSEIYTRD